MEGPGAAASTPGLSTRAAHARADAPRPGATLARSVRSATLSSEPEPGGEEEVRGTVDAFSRRSRGKPEAWADLEDAPER